jgi:hypothetical protein
MRHTYYYCPHRPSVEIKYPRPHTPRRPAQLQKEAVSGQPSAFSKRQKLTADR